MDYSLPQTRDEASSAQYDVLMALRRHVVVREWDEVRDQALQVWGSFSPAEIEPASKGWDELVSSIRRKTGESVVVVEAKLDHLLLRMLDELD